MSEFAKKYRELLEERKNIVYVFWNEPVWEKIYELLCNNMPETIKFLEEECTEEEFIYLSEIFPEITERTGSWEFIETLYKVCEKFPNAVKNYYIIGSIEEAEGNNEQVRLASGGFGQKNIELLEKYNIEYEISKIYENGVRIGNIPSHKNIKKQKGNNQTWFPSNWTSEKIKKAGEYVLNLKKNENVKDGQVITGIYDGVKVGVIKIKGIPSTIFPDKDQSEALKRRKKKWVNLQKNIQKKQKHTIL